MGVVIVVADAASVQPPLPTSYWGSVRIAGNLSPMPNTSITVLDANGNVIVNAISNSDGSYLVIVPWDDPATTQVEGVVAGQTINFKVSGKTVASRVIDAQGTNNRLDINVPTTTTTTTTTTSGGSASGTGTPAVTATGTPAVTATGTPAITVTETPAITVTETPAITATGTPAKATTTITVTPSKKIPTISSWITMVVMILVAVYIKALGKKRDS